MNKAEVNICQCSHCEARVHCQRSREMAEEARSAATALATGILAGVVGAICMGLGAWLW